MLLSAALPYNKLKNRGGNTHERIFPSEKQTPCRTGGGRNLPLYSGYPLEPGAKLPNEFELGEKFGVGRSTVREAVKLLSSKGIVEVRRGSGTYVVTTAKGLSDPLNLRSVQDKNALALDLVNVRLLLEPAWPRWQR